MAGRRIGKTLNPYVQKAPDAALLAVEVYNEPAVSLKSSASISLVVMASSSASAILQRHRSPWRTDPAS